MAPRPFLSLPCELRHMVYKFYFTTKQGYHFNAASRKLTAANGEPIDLALMYTCRFIAGETKEMPFLYNHICFKTFYQKDLSVWLCRFNWLVAAQFRKQIQLLIQLSPFITPEIQLRVKERFPWFVASLSSALTYHNNPGLGWRDRFDICPNDRARSAHREAIEFTLRLLCERSGEQFIKTINESLVGWENSGGARLSNFLNRCYEPWRFPSLLSDLEEMGSRLGEHEAWPSMTAWKTSRRHNMQYRSVYRFSAVSAAICFLDALPINKRSSLRNITIHEDRVSAGEPDGHAIGLIPFCQENGRLRIKHKFSMVRNIFERAYMSEFGVEEDNWSAEIMFRFAGMNLYTVVGNCLSEAMYLPDAGMPDGSYTLLLDGEDAGDLCSAFFQKEVLKKEARRLILDRALKEDPNSAWAGDYLYDMKFLLEGHAGALAHLCNKTSFFESNFYPGHLNNVDALMAHYRGVGLDRCIAELVFGDMAYDYDFESFRHVPRWGPMVMENFEWRKLPEDRPIPYGEIRL
ncbi:uncharacterized protein FTJAE_4647 [Fusarium tjaetaba]|uniref:Uncharacterized protein n=1 Tax=Fusarium tjaetaba TaxID=1567544 RepID=A0A8H5VZF7_9HYPO|nr:uncharacterized protein FTJAE_4647 [Fusarium tjaetaba]KAF5640100.1 hypothetical protein FTJAE_4647 [Fusarium tjaetaba]